MFDCLGADLFAFAFDDSASSKLQLSSQSESKKITICAIARHTSCKRKYKSADLTAAHSGRAVLQKSYPYQCAKPLQRFQHLLCAWCPTRTNVQRHRLFIEAYATKHMCFSLVQRIPVPMHGHPWKGHTPNMFNAFMVRRRNNGEAGLMLRRDDPMDIAPFLTQCDISAQHGTDSSFHLQNRPRWRVCQILAFVPKVICDVVKREVFGSFRSPVLEELFAGFLNQRFQALCPYFWRQLPQISANRVTSVCFHLARTPLHASPAHVGQESRELLIFDGVVRKVYGHLLHDGEECTVILSLPLQ